MNVTDLQLLYAYNEWAMNLILTQAAKLSPEQLTQPTSFSWGSLFATIVHTLDSQHNWRILCQQGRLVFGTQDIGTFQTIEQLTAYWQQEHADWRAYLSSLQDSELEGIIRYEVEEGVRERVLWHCLMHVVNHGTQHRSECAAMLTDFGHSPGGIDLSLFLLI